MSFARPAEGVKTIVRWSLARLTLPDTTSTATYGGTASYIPGAADGFVNASFFIQIIPTPGAIALRVIGAWGGTERSVRAAVTKAVSRDC